MTTPKIALVTDTDASLPREVAARYRIWQVPIMVHFGDESLRAVYDLDDAATFARIRQEGRLPTTAAPAPGQFVDAFLEAFEQGAEQVLCFTVSSKVSATWKAAQAARAMLPQRDITVVDTRSLSIGEGFMVLAAAEAVAAGASVAEAIAAAEWTREHTHLYAALATLKYLAMSGRVSHMVAKMAGALNIRPILTIKDGELALLEKARTRRKAWQRVLALARQHVGERPPQRLSILHINAPEEARAFEKILCEAIPCPEERLYAELTPGLSVHAGEGLVGVAFVTE